jgi:hypothetical protein
MEAGVKKLSRAGRPVLSDERIIAVTGIVSCVIAILQLIFLVQDIPCVILEIQQTRDGDSHSNRTQNS